MNLLEGNALELQIRSSLYSSKNLHVIYFLDVMYTRFKISDFNRNESFNVPRRSTTPCQDETWRQMKEEVNITTSTEGIRPPFTSTMRLRHFLLEIMFFF